MQLGTGRVTMYRAGLEKVGRGQVRVALKVRRHEMVDRSTIDIARLVQAIMLVSCVVDVARGMSARSSTCPSSRRNCCASF